ncbi:MAG: hypothetical protein HY048_12825 [Acidobacteria bacterium]|nr:hypothetical protein [Acidobacteriota bacterium]
MTWLCTLLHRALLVLFALVCASFAGCGPSIDLTQGLTIEAVSTGWIDAGLVGGQNKLVPTVSLKLKNVSDRPLPALQVNAVFRRVGEYDEFGSRFLTAAGRDGLASSATTDTLVLKSNLGYTSTDPRDEMLTNSHFVDAKVDVFAKYGSTQWTRVGEYQIDRRLMPR